MGIRKKIIAGFVTLAVLLFFSGVISLVELRGLSSETEALFEAGTKKSGYARDMLDALQQQAILFLRNNQPAGQAVQVLGTIPVDSSYRVLKSDFELALAGIAGNERDSTEIKAIHLAYGPYKNQVEKFFSGGYTDGLAWERDYLEKYVPLSSSIKDYMAYRQETLHVQASHIGNTAYRAITPGILALGVGIVILLIFLYLIDIYFARPVVAINRSLRGYLTSRLPFQVKMEGRDEVLELKEQIDDLVALNKKKKE